MKLLVAVPVFNEQKHAAAVLERLTDISRHPVLVGASDRVELTVLVIDDGSTDATPSLLAHFPVEVIRHATNRGYGHSLQDAFRWARVDGHDWVITMDCDEQHEPAAIPSFVEAIREDDADVVSGSRYLAPPDDAEGSPPPDRRRINTGVTAELNQRLGFKITDAFCGFKAYRTSSLERLSFNVDGYAFPLQFWVQAAAKGLRVKEVPVKLIYNDLNRSFGGPLDDAAKRLEHYRQVLHCELKRWEHELPAEAIAGAECLGS